MKKLLLLCLVFVVTALHFDASGQEAPRKETIIVGKFVTGAKVGSANTESIRQGVLNGFAHKGRMNVIDASNNAELQRMNEERGTEDMVDVSNVLSESNSAVFKSLGANYLLSGTTNNYARTVETRTVEGKSYTTYTVKMTFTLSGYNILEGTLIASSEIELYGLGKTPSEADLSALSDVSRKMTAYVNRNFPFTTYILALEATDKKGNIKQLYLHCGTDIGVQKGDLFNVMQEISIGGVKTKKRIAKLRAIEVNELTKCVVSDGGDALKEIYADGDESKIKTLTVVSGGESFGASLFR